MKNGWTYIRLAAVAVFWGASFNAGELAVQAMPPLTVTAWRFIIATILMLLLFLIKERPSWSSIRSSLWVYILLGVVGVFVTNALQFTALMYTPPLHPALIMATNPMLTSILAVPLLKESIRLRQIFGMLCSMVGVLLVITNGALLQIASISLGDLLAMGANITWALYGVLGRKLLRNSTPMATSTMTMAVAPAFCESLYGRRFAVFPYDSMAGHCLYGDIWCGPYFSLVESRYSEGRSKSNLCVF